MSSTFYIQGSVYLFKDTLVISHSVFEIYLNSVLLLFSLKYG